MPLSDDEDENLAQFLESEVLSEVSDLVFRLFIIFFFVFRDMINDSGSRYIRALNWESEKTFVSFFEYLFL